MSEPLSPAPDAADREEVAGPEEDDAGQDQLPGDEEDAGPDLLPGAADDAGDPDPAAGAEPVRFRTPEPGHRLTSADLGAGGTGS